MIGAENVDQQVEPPLHLVEVIGDVGGEIGPGPIRLHHRAVDVVAIGGGAEQGLLTLLPILGQLTLGRRQRTFVKEALGTEAFQRRLDPPAGIERLFGIEDVHLNAERRQILPDHVHHLVGREVADGDKPVFFRLVEQAVAEFRLQRLADGDEVIAGVKPLNDFNLAPMRLLIPQVG